MTTYAIGCNENGLLRFSCRITDFARYAKENLVLPTLLNAHKCACQYDDEIGVILTSMERLFDKMTMNMVSYWHE